MLLSVMVAAAFAEPEPEPVAEPQYYKQLYEAVKYPKAGYKPDYPSPSYKSYPELYPKPGNLKFKFHTFVILS